MQQVYNISKMYDVWFEKTTVTGVATVFIKSGCLTIGIRRIKEWRRPSLLRKHLVDAYLTL